MTVRMLRAFNGAFPGQIVTLAGAEETRLIGIGFATTSLYEPSTSAVKAARDSSGLTTGLVDGAENLLALSEVSAYVAATPSSGATLVTGACEFAGYICTTAAGNITIYDGTSAAGRVIVPTTALVLGAYPIMGAGTNGKLALSAGCHVVLSGAGAVNVAVG